MWNQSIAQVVPYAPYQTDASGNVTQTLSGVFILLSRTLVDFLKANLSTADQAALEGYVFNVTADQAGLWHVPVWASDDHAVYVRVPPSIWSDPTTDPPAAVKKFVQRLWQDATQ